ncbi:MAG: T9SS type A sorting domain-containing protein, partial [Bacteroidetes bacterium]|nr:T9SS type A sorting domain-containing protein [Bacteroidota bacterium]
NCYVFVENTSWSSGKVTQAAVNAVINEFDNKTPANPNVGIFQTDVNTFGNPPDVDNDQKIIIEILDIQDTYSQTKTGGWVAGYFYSYNETNQIQSNQAEIYFMDCNPTNLSDTTAGGGFETALETCAHEFQHMINWNYHKTNPEATFINEGLSMFAEINCGYPASFQGLYANEPNYYLLGWRGSDNTLVLNDYARAQRFFIYWNDQFGTGSIKNVVQDNLTGVSGLVNALFKSGQSLSFGQLMTNWEMANKLNDRSVNTSWGYLYPNLPASVSKTFYTPNVTATDTVNQLAAKYISFKNGSNLNITFTAPANSIVIKAIETGNGTTRVLDVPLNSQFSEPAFGSTYSTINFAVIDTNQSSSQIFTYQATGTTISNTTELKWDISEPTGYYVWTTSDTVCVTFDAFPGGKLDSIRVALRRAGSITGGVWQYTGSPTPTPLGKKLAVPITASISTTTPLPYPIPYQNWTTVDLRSYNISTDQPFAVGFAIGSVPNTPGVMATDYASTSAYHSFTYLQTADQVSAPGWYYITTNNAGDTVAIYLIRAYVSLVTGVQPEIELTPNQFSLSQNYPNPFNPSTSIDFTLPKAEKVRIAIYNQLGQQVSQVADKEYSPGSYSIKFNGDNLSSGVYYYRIEAGSFVLTKKMILLK